MGNHKKIYIVDDDLVTLMLLNHMIGVKHHSVIKPIQFQDPGKALNEFKNAPEDVEVLVFLDLNMPHVSGEDILKCIDRNLSPERAKVVIVSSSIDKRDKLLQDEYKPVVHYLEKPVTNEKMNELKTLDSVKPFFAN